MELAVTLSTSTVRWSSRHFEMYLVTCTDQIGLGEASLGSGHGT